MAYITLPPDKISTRNRRQLLIAVLVIAIGVFFGEIYSYANFEVWLVTHLLTFSIFGFGLLWPAFKDRCWPVTPLDAPLLAMSLAMIVSAVLSAWPRLALEGIFTWFGHVLAFYLVISLMYRGWTDSLLRALMLVTGVVVLIGLFELTAWYFGLPFLSQFAYGWWKIGGLSSPVPPVWYRLSFTLANSVVLAAYLVIVIPPIIAFAFTTRRPADRPVVWLFILVANVVLLATVSRGSGLGLAAGLGVLILLWLWRRKQKQITLNFGLTRILVFMGYGLLVSITVLFIWWISGSRAGSNNERLAYWQAAAHLFAENPVWGVGPGLFRWGWRLTPAATQISDRVVSAHSLYFNHLAELGTVGGLMGVWLLLSIAFVAWQVLDQTKDERLWWRRAGCVAGLAGFLAHGLVETFATWPIALPVIILVAYVTAPYQLLVVRAREISSSEKALLSRMLRFNVILNHFAGRYGGWLIAASWLLCFSITSYFAYPRLLAEYARQAATSGNLKRATALMRRSVALDPGLTLYQFELANWLASSDLGRYQEAKSIYQNALHKEPTYGLNYANLATVQWQIGDRQAALREIKLATQRAPQIAEFWLTLGFYAEKIGNDEQALAAYVQTLTRRQDWISSDFWRATEWRTNNFPHILARLKVQLSEGQHLRLLFDYYLQDNEFSLAELVLRQMESHKSVDPFTREFSAAKFNLALSHLARAHIHIQSALQMKPTHPEAHALHAQILIAMNKPTEAQKALNWSLFLSKGKSISAKYAQGLLKQQQGLVTEAEAAFRQAHAPRTFSLDYSVAMYRQVSSLLPRPGLQYTTAGPTAVRGWFALAALYKQQGEVEKAAEIYRALLDEDPLLGQARQELAMLCERHEELCYDNAVGQ